jgi:hypothetical protein
MFMMSLPFDRLTIGARQFRQRPLSILERLDRQEVKGEVAMPEYMILIHEDEGEQARIAPSETKRLIEAHTAYVKSLKSAGAYRDGERLRPSAEGRRIRARAGRAEVEPGPFADDNRALAGYYLVRADDLAAAVALAESCPTAPGDTLDVRPLMKGNVRGDKGDARGKTFAFGVLGNAANERGWVEVMDRIDADTSAGFPTEQFLGGVRLEAPGKGRHIVWRGGKRAVMDGPFLESKEVIGGLFFLRLASLDEAVAWAALSKFVVHGALEVRELWRS